MLLSDDLGGLRHSSVVELFKTGMNVIFVPVVVVVCSAED